MARQSASWQGWSNLTLPSTEEATVSSGLIGSTGGISRTSLKYETTLPTRCCAGELAANPKVWPAGSARSSSAQRFPVRLLTRYRRNPSISGSGEICRRRHSATSAWTWAAACSEALKERSSPESPPSAPAKPVARDWKSSSFTLAPAMASAAGPISTAEVSVPVRRASSRTGSPLRISSAVNVSAATRPSTL